MTRADDLAEAVRRYKALTQNRPGMESEESVDHAFAMASARRTLWGTLAAYDAAASNPQEHLLERFLEHVDTRPGDDSGCWLWTGSTSGNGYGSFSVEGRIQPAHRVAWTLLRAPIQEGLWVLHHCDTPTCVRPRHLFLGTHSDNMQDMVRKGRGVANRGEDNGIAKLTDDDVREIRRLYALGRTQKQIAAELPVTQSNVSLILRGKRWTHVSQAEEVGDE